MIRRNDCRVPDSVAFYVRSEKGCGPLSWAPGRLIVMTRSVDCIVLDAKRPGKGALVDSHFWAPRTGVGGEAARVSAATLVITLATCVLSHSQRQLS